MSRIGKQPVKLPAGVKAKLASHVLWIESGSNKLSQWVDPR